MVGLRPNHIRRYMLSHDVIKSFDGTNDFLSNFYHAPIMMGHYWFSTNEHAFQAAKYLAMPSALQEQYIKSVIDQNSPSKAKYVGRAVTIDVVRWDSVKVRAMRDIVMCKFLQHEQLRDKLVATGAGMLVEGNDWNDRFWGRCEGKGLNVLGSILMEVRGYFTWRGTDNGNPIDDGSVFFDRSPW